MKEYRYNGIFEGEYINGEKNGKGKEYDKYSELMFEGEYFNGNRWNGKGTEYNENGILEFDGEYMNGKKWNGIITEYDWDSGEIIFNGRITNGEKVEI